ncbi:MAG: hypothetical protein KatS3mg078_1989 [Deltaproteobacteria bacterium]|nr:MAG: hypothetical protein KatS3mg078_1989 [Deltaproteobacteria bacterium]
MYTRREFIKLIFSTTILLDNKKRYLPPIEIGLGDDPEKILKWDRNASSIVLERISPTFLTAWLNAKDSRSSNIGDWLGWKESGFLRELKSLGYNLHVITWEDSKLTDGKYHISPKFKKDVKEITKIARSEGILSPMFSLATEFTTYVEPWDTYNERTKPYYKEFIKNISSATEGIKSILPRAKVSISWGGWIATFDDPSRVRGKSIIPYFGELMRRMDFISFQSMVEHKTGELPNNDPSHNVSGNPEQIILCLKTFRRWKKPLMVSHFAPHNKRADVLADDLWRMSGTKWQKLARELGLFALSHMWYELFKENDFGCLDAAENFTGISYAEIRV